MHKEQICGPVPRCGHTKLRSPWAPRPSSSSCWCPLWSGESRGSDDIDMAMGDSGFVRRELCAGDDRFIPVMPPPFVGWLLLLRLLLLLLLPCVLIRMVRVSPY